MCTPDQPLAGNKGLSSSLVPPKIFQLALEGGD